MSGEDFFDAAYDLETGEETAAHYARFADRYEAAMRENGYATPARCAEALRHAQVPQDAAILDIGCGTGMSGQAIRDAGYGTIDGIDLSADMLAVARSKGIYRTVIEGGLDALPEEAWYGGAVAAGVFSPGHAPPDLIPATLDRLEPGGVFVFSLNDHAIAERVYEGQVHDLLDAGSAELVVREYGDHMPRQDVKAWVYALRRP